MPLLWSPQGMQGRTDRRTVSTHTHTGTHTHTHTHTHTSHSYTHTISHTQGGTSLYIFCRAAARWAESDYTHSARAHIEPHKQPNTHSILTHTQTHMCTHRYKSSSDRAGVKKQKIKFKFEEEKCWK